MVKISEDDQNVTLLKRNNKEISVALDDLCEDDQSYIKKNNKVKNFETFSYYNEEPTITIPFFGIRLGDTLDKQAQYFQYRKRK